jgi:hypothetical protein
MLLPLPEHVRIVANSKYGANHVIIRGYKSIAAESLTAQINTQCKFTISRDAKIEKFYPRTKFKKKNEIVPKGVES